MQAKEIAQYALKALMESGAEKAKCVLTSSEKNELNLEADNINLLRTTFNNGLGLKVIKGNCIGNISINKTDKDSIDQAVKDVLELAKASQPDDAHDISPMQEAAEFSYGVDSPDLDKMCQRLVEFQQETKKRYPTTILEGCMVDYNRTTSYILNSNGVDFKETKGSYNFMAMFTSKEDGNVSSFNYDSVSLKNLDKPLIETAQFDTLLRQSGEQTVLKPLEGKFVGDVIVTPNAFDSFLGSYLSYLGDYYMISGSSVFKDQVGEQIAHESLSISSNPTSELLADRDFVTSGGYRAEDLKIIENGKLNTYLLSQYGANKTKLENVRNDANRPFVSAGNKELAEMIKSVKKGLLLCRFSGGRPSGNGDFSGVAKNSYYIEDGKIQFPVQEVMVSGNLVEGFKNITDISSERNESGSGFIPWVQISGWTVSGK